MFHLFLFQGGHLFLEEELAVAVMGVALQWDSHTKTREGQLGGRASEVLKVGLGMGNAAALVLQNQCAGGQMSVPFLLNGSAWG